MIIKNKYLISAIKSADKNIINELFNKYLDKNSIETLSTVFFRYKPLWLALKTSKTAYTINKMRRLANTHNIPQKVKVLDRITWDNNIDLGEVKKELANVTLFKKVSLLNTLSYRLTNPTGFVYRIRNGRSFITDKKQNKRPSMAIYNIILNSIINDVKKQVEGKVVLIPENISYAFPTSEKNFIGPVPFGSSFSFGKNKDVILGVHWENSIVKGKEVRMDLDLSSSNEG